MLLFTENTQIYVTVVKKQADLLRYVQHSWKICWGFDQFRNSRLVTHNLEVFVTEWYDRICVFTNMYIFNVSDSTEIYYVKCTQSYMALTTTTTTPV